MANTTKRVSKIEGTTTTTSKPATAKKQTTKKEPVKDLDWRAVGIVKEHQAARVRGKRRIERLQLRYLAYSASAFVMGASVGIMVFSWLH